MIIRIFDALQARWVRFDRWFGLLTDKINPYKPEKLVITDLKPVIVEESGIRKRTVQIVLVASSAFLIWATVAPMDAGVNLAGKVMVSGKRKAVAHPTGGVVQEILVKEGDVVQKDQVLLRINPLTTEANLNDAELEHYNALATESRLLAERDDMPVIKWMPELLAQLEKDPRAKQAQSVQQEVFLSGRSAPRTNHLDPKSGHPAPTIDRATNRAGLEKRTVAHLVTRSGQQQSLGLGGLYSFGHSQRSGAPTQWFIGQHFKQRDPNFRYAIANFFHPVGIDSKTLPVRERSQRKAQRRSEVPQIHLGQGRVLAF
jgi:Biotin-lipoyl like